jgi:hypothetical protein
MGQASFAPRNRRISFFKNQIGTPPMNWILIIMIAGSPTVVPGFQDDWACKAAGKTIVKDIGDTAKYWCFSTS